MIVVDVKLKGYASLRKSQINAAMKAAMRTLGVFWHGQILPAKWGPHATAKYHLAGRSRQYQRTKLRRFGHTRPLEFSGEGRRLAVSVETRHRIRSTRDRVTIPLPAKFNWRPRGGRIKLGDELRRVTEDELREMTSVLVGQIELELEMAGGETGSVRAKLARFRPAG